MVTKAAAFQGKFASKGWNIGSDDIIINKFDDWTGVKMRSNLPVAAKCLDVPRTSHKATITNTLPFLNNH